MNTKEIGHNNVTTEKMIESFLLIEDRQSIVNQPTSSSRAAESIEDRQYDKQATSCIFERKVEEKSELPRDENTEMKLKVTTTNGEITTTSTNVSMECRPLKIICQERLERLKFSARESMDRMRQRSEESQKYHNETLRMVDELLEEKAQTVEKSILKMNECFQSFALEELDRLGNLNQLYQETTQKMDETIESIQIQRSSNELKQEEVIEQLQNIQGSFKEISDTTLDLNDANLPLENEEISKMLNKV